MLVASPANWTVVLCQVTICPFPSASELFPARDTGIPIAASYNGQRVSFAGLRSEAKRDYLICTARSGPTITPELIPTASLFKVSYLPLPISWFIIFYCHCSSGPLHFSSRESIVLLGIPGPSYIRIQI